MQLPSRRLLLPSSRAKRGDPEPAAPTLLGRSTEKSAGCRRRASLDRHVASLLAMTEPQLGSCGRMQGSASGRRLGSRRSVGGAISASVLCVFRHLRRLSGPKFVAGAGDANEPTSKLSRVRVPRPTLFSGRELNLSNGLQPFFRANATARKSARTAVIASQAWRSRGRQASRRSAQESADLIGGSRRVWIAASLRSSRRRAPILADIGA